jgi:hypothetical protein
MLEYGPTFWITALILVVAYVTLEIYHGLSRRSGTIVRFIDQPLPLASLVGCRVEVELENGRQVQAEASGCVLCQNSIGPGAKVFLVRNKNGWLVSSSDRHGCRK